MQKDKEFAQDIPQDLALAVKSVSNLPGTATEMEGYEYVYGIDHVLVSMPNQYSNYGTTCHFSMAP
jgi:hypothetical protein